MPNESEIANDARTERGAPVRCDDGFTVTHYCFDVWSEGADVWRRESQHVTQSEADERRADFLRKWSGAITRIVARTITEKTVNEALCGGGQQSQKST